MNIYYTICFLASVVLLMVYIYLWRDYYNIYFTIIQILVPIVNMGCLWLANARSLESAILANRILYMGGCFIPPVLVSMIYEVCGLKPKKAWYLGSYIMMTLVYLSVLTSDFSDIFYKSFSFVIRDGVLVLYKEYGFMHTVAYIAIGIHAVVGCAIVIWSLITKRRASVRNMYYMLAAMAASGVFFLAIAVLHSKVEPSCFYLIAQAFGLLAADRTHYYNEDRSISEIMVNDGSIGYINFDWDKRFLSASKTAEEWFPELASLHPDEQLDSRKGIKGELPKWFKRIDAGEKQVFETMPSDTKSIAITVENFEMRNGRRGYRVFMKDDTDHVKLVKMLNEDKRRAEEEREKISDTFEKYMDPNIIKDLVKTENGMMTAGEEHNVAVLFADIRGFTAMSETRSPHEVINILNTCLDSMVACIMQNRGVLDKIIGDCAMAFWSDKNLEGEAAYMACKTAADMQTAIEDVNRELERIYGMGLKIGIGINYGPAIIGNVGTDYRRNFTVIGDTVNVASRLEGIAAAGEILITREVEELIRFRAETEPIGESVRLKGRTGATDVFRILTLGGRTVKK